MIKSNRILKAIAAVLFLLPGLALGAPQPSAIAAGDQQPFIGENFSIQVAFDNIDPADTGYGPFLDVVLPVNGADGVGGTGTDGIDIVGGATYLGVSVTTVEQTFPDDGAGTGCVNHPYAVDTAGAPLQVCGVAGDKLVTIELPFGSFVPDQPPAAVDLNLTLSNFADLGAGLTLYSRAGFRFGADALDNPSTDPSILSNANADPSTWAGQTAVTPRLIALTKAYSGPEDETATGPNFPRRYTITVEVAPGQTVTDLDVTDFLPNNMAFLSLIGSSSSGGAGTATSTPTVGTAANPPNNELTVNFASVTGGTPITVTFEYFIPRLDAGNAVIIDAASGDDETSENQARAVGDWTPLDSRDAGATDNAVADPVGVEHTLEDKSIAIQKSVAIFNDTGAPGEENPGDTLEYTLTFQVSDYFSFDDVVVTDVISDGQRFDSAFTPTLTLTRHGATSAEAPMSTFNYASGGDVDERYTGASVNPVGPIDGTTLFRFRVSDELAVRADAANDPRLTGGCVPDGGTGAGNPPDCSVFDGGATTATIKFRTIIQQEFSDDYPSGDPSVDQGDVLTNDVTVAGNLLLVEDNATPTGQTEEDTSAASVSIAFGTLSKEIYKVNGADPVGNPIQVQPGDTITYRLQYSMPTSDVESLVFTDYLPKPVLVATEVTSFEDSNTLPPPVAGAAKYGPADTFGDGHGGVYPGVPAIASNAQENSLTFTFGHYDNSDQMARNIDMLFTVTVNDEPFADGLFLTNQLRVTQGSTNAGDAQADAIIQIQLQEPVLEITKGVSATSNTGSSISPPPSTTPIDGNLSDADAGDQVTFVITVENTGHAPAYDVLISDSSPAELTACALDSVTNDGSTETGHTISDLQGTGITLDSSLAAGAQALVTLTCDVAATVNPNTSFDNEATVEWRAQPGAATAFPSKSDTATVSIAPPGVAKSLANVAPGGAAPNITVGDVLTYTITVTVPEGVTQNLTLTDTLPNGLAFQSGSVTVIPGSFAGTLTTSPTVAVAGQVVTIGFGDVTGTGSTGTQDNTFTVTLQALVEDVSANDALNSLQGKTNAVTLDYATGPALNATAATSFAEPELQITKTMSGPVDAGDTITVTLVIENTGTSPAYDISVTDILNDSGNLFDLASIAEGSTPTGFTYSYASPTVTYQSASGYSLAVGATATFTFTGTAHSSVEAGFAYNNDAEVNGDGQDGSVTGERQTSDTDTGSVSVTQSAVIKQIIDSSEAWTTPHDHLAIGEIVTYQLTFDIPEGVITEDGANAIITDQLPTGFQFVTGTARISTANVDNSISGSDYGPLPASPTSITPGVAGSPEVLSFDLGSITNSDSDGDTEQIIIAYEVLVLNSADNQRSDTKTNTGGINYLNDAGTPQSTTAQATATIAEPDLAVTKTALPATVQGNDTVTFTVTISNPPGTDVSRVWEVTLSDVLPARYDSNYQLNSAILSRGSQDVAACGAFGGAGGNELSFDMSCLPAADRYLDPGDTIVLEYQADVDIAIPYEENVTNTVNVAGTSLPGDNGTGSATPGVPGDSDGERTGDTSGGAGSENDISASDSATVSSGVPTISKTGDASLAVGDVTTMTLEVDVPVGATTGFVITDDLPAGLRYTGAMTNSHSANTATFTATNNPMANLPAGADPLVFDFGDITNTGASAQRITITYEVEVENIIANQRGDNLTNTASLTYDGASANPSDTATVVVLEPDLEITKTITAGSTGSDAGDAISYQVVITNGGDSTAYGVDLRDVLPAELLGAPDGSGSASPYFLNITVDNDSGAVVQTGGGSALLATDASFVTTTNTDDTLTWPLFDLPDSATLTITYDAILHNNVVAGAVLTNTATAEYTSLTGGQGRSNADAGDDDDDSLLDNYGETDSISFTVDSTINLQKNLNGSHADNDFTIGDLITFDIRVDLVEGVTNDVAVTDTLPAGLVQVGTARIVAGSHISYTGSPDLGALNWSMGDVTNISDGVDTNDYFIIEVDALVEDVPTNVEGLMLTNSAEVTSASGGPVSDTTDVDIVEPNLVVSKTASDTTPSLGDTVTFTVEAQHDSSSADAYDVRVTDLIPAGMTYVPGSHGGDGSVDESNASQPVFDLGAITLLEVSKTFTFDVTIDLDATVGAPITNPVDLDYDGQPNDPAVQRSYTGGASEVVTPHIDASIDATKTVALVVDVGSNGVVDPGDTLEYSITLTNEGDPVTNAVFTDPLPVNTSYVAGTLTTTKGTADDSGNPLRVDVGDMAASETVVITFRVTVDAGTPVGTVISNQGSVDSDQTVPEPTDQDGLDSNGDQPTDIPVGGTGGLPADLYTVKSVLWNTDADASGDITAGDTMRYVLTMENTGGVDLTGVTLTDTIPAGLTFVPGTESVTGVGNTISVVGSTLSVSVPSLPVGASVAIQFDVTIDAFAPSTQTYTNQADTDSDQTGPDQSDGNGFPGDGNQPTDFTAVNGVSGAPALDLEKRVQLAVDPDGDGMTDPGDTLRYIMTLTNTGSADATNVRIQDAIPANTSVVPGSVVTSQGTVVSENPVNINIGVLPAAGIAVIEFRVTVDMGAADGTVISNQAAATADGGINESSDDNGLDGDGHNPNLTPVHTHGGGSIPGTPELNKSLFASSESDSVAQNVLIGEVLTYRIEAVMPAGALAGLTIVDTLPAGLGYVANSARLSRTFDTGLLSANDPGGINASPSGAFINLTDGVDVQISGGVITLSLGSITNSDNDTNDETYVLELRVVVANIAANQEGVVLGNNAVLSYLDGLGQPQSLAPESVDVTILEPHLAVQKAVSPGTILPEGGSVTYTITVTNPDLGNSAPAYDVVISDSLPGEFTSMTVDSVTPSGGVSGVVNSSSGTTLGFSVATFPVDGVLTIQVTAIAPGGMTVGNTLVNTAQVVGTSLPGDNGTAGVTPGSPGSSTGERTGSGSVNDHQDSGSATVNVTPEIDLQLTKVVDNATPNVGDTVTFTIQVSNNGPSDATGVAVQDVVPDGYAGIANISNGGSESGGIITWSGLSIANGAGVSLTFDAVVQASGDYTNSAEISAANEADTDSTPGNNDPAEDDQDSASVVPIVIDLSLLKSVDNPTPEVGETVTFTIDLSNAGPGDATGVAVQDVVPDGYAGIANISNGGSLAGSTISWSNLSVASGGTLSMSFTAVVQATGDYLNAAEVTAANEHDTDSVPGDGTGDDHDTATLGPVGVIGNYVWHDDDHDGVQDAEESGVAGVTVNLLDDAGNLIASTVTDGSGYYQFTGVDAGDYQLEFLPSADYGFTTRDQGAGPLQDRFDSDADESTGRTAVFTLGAGESNQTLDAGLVLNTGSPASIGDRVWYDSNNDGIQDAGEPGIAGVTVNLYDAGMNLLASVVTDGNGDYEFAGLAAGDYIVGFQAPAGYNISPQSQGGDAAADSDADPATGNTAVISLADGERNDQVDAGMNIPSAAPASIGDFVWYDTNNDGVQDAGEPGLGGVVVYLYAANDLDTPIASIVTDANGGYRFTGLPAGDYVVGFVAPDGLAFVPTGGGAADTDSDADPATGMSQPITLSSGEAVDDVDAGLFGQSTGSLITIGDLIWLDANHDGTADTGEGLAGVDVVLYDAAGNELMRTTTDANGNYLFADLLPGDYRVEVDTTTLPAGVVQIADPDETGSCVTCDSASDLIGQSNDIDTVDFGYGYLIDLELTKSVSAGPHDVGDTVTFTIEVSNNGPSNATGVAVQDVVPDGYAGIANISNGGSESSGAITWSGLSIANGDSISLTFDAVIQASGDYTNVAQVSASDQPDVDSTPGNDAPAEDDQDSAVVTPGAVIDLELTKSVSAGPHSVGDTVTFTIEVSNNGPSDATGVAVRDVVPNGYAGIANISNGGSESGGIITWSGLSIANGDSINLTFDAVIQASGSYVNVAQVSASDQPDVDSTPGNDAPGEDDQDNAVVMPGALIDLDLTKTASGGPTYTEGDVVTFTLTITNAGPSDATGVEVTDPVPDGFGTITDISNGGVLSGNTIVWAGLDIAAGASLSLQFDARLLAQGNHTNTAEVTGANETDVDSIPDNGDSGEDDIGNVTLTVGPDALPPAPIPTLSEWLLILLGMLLAVVGAGAVNSRHQRR